MPNGPIAGTGGGSPGRVTQARHTLLVVPLAEATTELQTVSFSFSPVIVTSWVTTRLVPWERDKPDHV
jgi:hypothetical protein